MKPKKEEHPDENEIVAARARIADRVARRMFWSNTADAALIVRVLDSALLELEKLRTAVARTVGSLRASELPRKVIGGKPDVQFTSGDPALGMGGVVEESHMEGDVRVIDKFHLKEVSAIDTSRLGPLTVGNDDPFDSFAREYDESLDHRPQTDDVSETFDLDQAPIDHTEE
jgi:hypothetical protein